MHKFPKDLDLRRLLRFSNEDGSIWLAQSRMLLLHAAAIAGMRKELIDSGGLDHARRIFTRMGYESGLRDVEVAKTIRAGQHVMDMFVVGPQLHTLEGIVQVTPEKLDMDIASGRFHAEVRWDNSWEAHAHVEAFGQQHGPVCWMQLGYASGYSSGFMGRFILYKETACLACGADHCQVVGRPVGEWEDGAEQAAFYEPDSLAQRMLDLHDEVDVLRSSRGERKRGGEGMMGGSPAFQSAYDLLLKVAPTSVTVLLSGETGVGKERFARSLHQNSTRADGPFVAVNCAAIPQDLVESELFGAEKGAYTGATATRPGKFERACGGTLFLDEIGELPLAAQAKILRALQEGEIERLGGEKTHKVDVRIVAATNVELEAAVRAGRFRADLYYRLNVYPIRIPPLRERTLDIPPMAKALLAKYGAVHAKRLGGISDSAMAALMRYRWPGNVRELENLIERGVILTEAGGWVELQHLFPSLDIVAGNASGPGASGALQPSATPQQQRLCEQILASGMRPDDVEAMLVDHALERSGGNISGAARMLGMTRSQLTYRQKLARK